VARGAAASVGAEAGEIKRKGSGDLIASRSKEPGIAWFSSFLEGISDSAAALAKSKVAFSSSASSSAAAAAGTTTTWGSVLAADSSETAAAGRPWPSSLISSGISILA